MTLGDDASDADLAHLDEIERLRAQHASAMHTLRSSFQYRLGNLLVEAATSRAGARQAPRGLVDLAREALRHKRGRPAPATQWHGTPARRVRIATILDEFSEVCLAPEFELERVDPGRQLDTGIDLLLAETTWQGNSGAWTQALSSGSPGAAEKLTSLITQCARAGVPTVLWNKEDPVNYEIFLRAARQFDWIFTTDGASIERYRRDVGHARLAVLPFAAQNRIHNPIGTRLETAERFAFAGGWRGDKYPRRGEQFRELLGPALDLGIVDIYDRYSDHPNRDNRFPADFADAVRPQLPYLDMVARYRDHAAFFNVNTVETSPTMLARRVMEILACRTPVVSTPARSIDELLGDVVLTASTAAESMAHVERLREDIDYRLRLAHRGYRHVHSHHTYAHRIDDMLAAVGVDSPTKSGLRPLTVICVSNRPDNLDRALRSYSAQIDVPKQLLFVANSDEFEHEQAERRVNDLGGRYVRVDERATLGECLNIAMAMVDTPLFAKFDDDDFYGPHHLLDLSLARNYTDAAVVGRTSYFVRLPDDRLYLRHPNREFMDVNFVAGGSFIADASLAREIPFESVPQGTDTRFMAAVRASGRRIFSASRFNYLMNRNADKSQHTWQASDAAITDNATRVFTASILDHVSV